MTTGDDKELQRLLEGDHPVARAWRDLPGATPPAALDEAILAAARAEARRPVRPRWLVPVSVAATVVLGVGLSLRQIDAPRQSVSDMTAPAASMEMTQDTAAGSDLNRVSRQAGGRFSEPVPKPGVEDLLQTEPLDGARREKANVDVKALRRRALADTTAFTPPPPPTLTESMVASEPPSEPARAFAPPPATARAPGAKRTHAAANRADAAEEAAAPLVADDDAVLYNLLPARPSDDDESGRVRRLVEAVRSGSYAGFSGESLDQSANAQPGGLSMQATQETRIEQRLELIRQLHRRGEQEAARILFDELLEAHPYIEVPRDYPLQPPVPEFEVPPTP